MSAASAMFAGKLGGVAFLLDDFGRQFCRHRTGFGFGTALSTFGQFSDALDECERVAAVVGIEGKSSSSAFTKSPASQAQAPAGAKRRFLRHSPRGKTEQAGRHTRRGAGAAN